MAYDAERVAADFRQQAEFSAALHKKHARYLDGSPLALATNDEIVAVWSVYEHLSFSGSVLLRQRLLTELARMRAGERPDRAVAPVFDEARFLGHRERLIQNLILRFEAEADAYPA
jgi:hypothetical protein